MIKGIDSRAAIIGAAAALVFVCSVAGVGVLVAKSHEPESVQAGADKGRTSLVRMGEFTVTLADTDELRYLKTDLVLEVRGELRRSAEEVLRTRVRDGVIGILSSKHLADLIKPDGRVKLKEEILAAVEDRTEATEVVNVYFNEFAMQ